jgi:prepilin-type N-terminal cleavage/methylation domain-containing protein
MSARRDGFTMVELLLVLVLGLVVIGGAVNTLVRQEQAYGQMQAMAGTQEDIRIGVELLAGELREISAEGGDLVLATDDSIRIRALRKFGLVCDVDKTGKRLVVAQEGVDPFSERDSVVVYVDQDPLKAADDIWQREYVTNVSTSATCTTLFGLLVPGLLPDADVIGITLQGSGLRFDSVFPGAPVRQYETVTYSAGAVDGETMLLLTTAAGNRYPLLGPLDGSAGLTFRYFDGQGIELTSTPLSATDRQNVHRIRLALRAAHWANARDGMHRDSVITDIFIRGG